MPKLGLIAGNRAFPVHVARAAKALGYEVICVGLKEETSPALEESCDRMHWVTFQELGTVPDLLKKEGVKQVILAGQVRPERLVAGDSKWEGMFRQLLAMVPDRSGTSAMQMAVRHLESLGFEVLHSGVFLKEWIPKAGLLTRRAPTPEEKEDLIAGLGLARQLSRLKIGQTVVIRQGAVVAVEAMEGTDAAIGRTGAITGGGAVVVKACGPDHDMRFDIPVVGLSTLEAMEAARIICLGVEADRTLLFDRPEFIRLADQKGFSITALP